MTLDRFKVGVKNPGVSSSPHVDLVGRVQGLPAMGARPVLMRHLLLVLPPTPQIQALLVHVKSTATPHHCRLFDVNRLAPDHPFFSLYKMSMQITQVSRAKVNGLAPTQRHDEQ